MKQMDFDDKVINELHSLQDKFSIDKQSLAGYLEGLRYSNYVKYWDYIKLDTLLSLQSPKTDIPDEMIFVAYHQITELFFKLVLWEINQITDNKDSMTSEIFLDKIMRINRYYKNLIKSFEIMTEGMAREQFLKFRTSLAPASGFQSYQYRLIEISCTDIKNLWSRKFKIQEENDAISFRKSYQRLYWKEGATDVSTGQKDLGLIHFEEKYNNILLHKAQIIQKNNINQVFKRRFMFGPSASLIKEAMREMDVLINVQWGLAHFKTAIKYLANGHFKSLEATGGTNWKQYLPPRFQRITFFPELWTDDEMENWGRNQIVDMIAQAA
jgi:tryptophan 2,3-dioxygenase